MSNTTAPQANIDGLVVPHELVNRMYLYFDANANVSDDCANFMEELGKLRSEKLEANAPPVQPEKTELQKLLIRRDTASWRHGELHMHGARKEAIAEAWNDLQELDVLIAEERRRIAQAAT